MERLWAVALVAIVVAPRESDTLEAAAMMQSAKDWSDVRTGGRGF